MAETEAGNLNSKSDLGDDSVLFYADADDATSTLGDTSKYAYSELGDSKSNLEASVSFISVNAKDINTNGTPSFTGTDSQDLNLISLNSVSQDDDIMSAMVAEDSLQFQKQGMEMEMDINTDMQMHMHMEMDMDMDMEAKRDFMHDLQNQELIHQLILQTKTVPSISSEDTDLTPYQVQLGDLEKSILAGQAKARVAEIDSPLHLNRRCRQRPSSDEKISSTVPKQPQVPYKHSSLSPFVLKRSQSEQFPKSDYHSEESQSRDHAQRMARTSVDVVPRPPSVTHSISAAASSRTDSNTGSRTRSRRLIHRITSSGCFICNHHSSRSLAKEETERGVTERNMTEREQTERHAEECNDHVSDDIHYIMNDDKNHLEHQSDSNHTNFKSRTSSGGIAKTITRNLSRRLSSQRNIVQQKHEEEEMQDDKNEGRRRQFVRSISRSIQSSFRIKKSRKSKGPGMSENQQKEEPTMIDTNRLEEYSQAQQDIHERDIVFDPNHVYKSEKETAPLKSIIGTTSLVHQLSQKSVTVDVDELQELLEHQQEQQKLQQKRMPQNRPNLVTTLSSSARGSVAFTSQDFTVVHNNQQKQHQRSSTKGTIDRQQSLTFLQVKAGNNDVKPKLPGAESNAHPKKPPNTRYNLRGPWGKNHSESSRVLGQVVEAEASSVTSRSTKTESVNTRRQMMLQTQTRGRSVRTMVTPNSVDDPRHILFQKTQKCRARSLEVWERRGSF